MGNALELQIVTFGGAIIQQQHGAFASGKILLKSENLPAITQRIASQQTQLREGIKHYALRLKPFHFGQHRVGSVRQLDFSRIEDRVLGFGFEVSLIRTQLEYLDPIERPAVRSCDFEKFGLRFGESDIEALLAATGTFHQELHGDRGLSRTRVAFDQIKVISGHTSAKNIVKANHPGGK